MATEVTLPELGESVTEGIIIDVLVEVGQTIEADDPVVEISTDKIDTEVPSPAAGTVTEIRVAVDDEVAVGQVLVVLDGDGGGGGGGDTAAADEAADDGGDAGAGGDDDTDEPETADEGGDQAEAASEPEKPAPAASSEPSAPASGSSSSGGTASGGGSDPGDRTATGDAALLSPLVRKMLREAGVSASAVKGTGQGGRITREDAERAIASGGDADAGAPASEAGAAPAQAQPQQAAASTQLVGIQTPQPQGGGDRPEASPHQVDFGGEREVTQDLSRVRKAIAKHMMDSLQSTAQLTAAVEVDVTRVMNTRAALKDDFKARHGASLSPLPIIARATMMVLPRHPAVNSSMDQAAGTATYHNYVNLGMAIDTEKGLLVPNIKDAQDLTIGGLAKKIADLAKRTRGKGLQPDEISGGTFTITNTGSRGTLFDTPILNPPESAILATCAIEKRPVVVNDGLGESIAIRWMTYLCLSYDHRMVDGADAARFLQDLKWVLENHDFAPEISG